MRAGKSVFSWIIFFILFPASAFPAGVATDFNGNGQSEFSLVSIDRKNGNKLLWHAVSASSIPPVTLGAFGKAGDHIITADWLGRGTPQVGVVALSKGKISWKIIDPATGGMLKKTMGSKGDIAVSGADFNNNGVADAAVIYQSKGKVMWKIWYDMFTSLPTAKIIRRAFGKRGDRFFFANPDGTGDWMCVLRKDGGKQSLILMKNPATNAQRAIGAPALFASSSRRPVPVKQLNGKDYLIFAVTSGAKTRFYQQKFDGTPVSSKVIAVNGEIVVGKFRRSGGEELAIQTADGFLVYDPDKLKQRRVVAPSGIAIDEININQVGGSPDDWSDGNPGGGTPTTGTLARVCAEFSPMQFPEMFVKSEASGHLKDPRSTGYTLLCGRQCPVNTSKADIFYADGTYACSVGIYSIWSATNKPRMYGGAADAPPHNARQIARKARGIGSGNLYLQISRARTGGNTFCKEFAPTGRVGGVETSYGVVR